MSDFTANDKEAPPAIDELPMPRRSPIGQLALTRSAPHGSWGFWTVLPTAGPWTWGNFRGGKASIPSFSTHYSERSPSPRSLVSTPTPPAPYQGRSSRRSSGRRHCITGCIVGLATCSRSSAVLPRGDREGTERNPRAIGAASTAANAAYIKLAFRRVLSDSEFSVVADLGCGTGERLVGLARHFYGQLGYQA